MKVIVDGLEEIKSQLAARTGLTCQESQHKKCAAMLLGTLMQHMHDRRLCAGPGGALPSYTGSLDGACNLLRSIPKVEWCEGTPSCSTRSAGYRDPGPQLTVELTPVTGQNLPLPFSADFGSSLKCIKASSCLTLSSSASDLSRSEPASMDFAACTGTSHSRSAHTCTGLDIVKSDSPSLPWVSRLAQFQKFARPQLTHTSCPSLIHPGFLEALSGPEAESCQNHNERVLMKIRDSTLLALGC